MPFEVRYKSRDGDTLEQVRAKLKNGDWWYSDLFAKVGYAKAWGKFPSELGLCSPEENADLMFAYCMARGTMDAYESQLQADEIERNRRKGRRR
jgi:hypothetical protein